MPKVSVIIPCYNQGQYIDEAVESVLNQTYKDFEIIIINDGSTEDFTKKLLHNYKKPKTRVLHTDNQGLASARNEGIKEANGKYILPLDSDDKIGGEYLEEAVNILDENPGIGIVYCKAESFGAVDGKWELPEYSLEEMLVDNIIFCSAFFRKEDWEKVGGYNPDMIYGWEDYDLWLSLIEKNILIYQIPKVLFYYRVLAGSMVKSKSRKQKVEMFVKIFHKHQDLFVKNIDIWIDRIIGDTQNYVAQLYIDTGLGYNEKQVMSQVIHGEGKRLEFDLDSFSNIRSFRFDPANDYSVLHINSIKIVREDNSSVLLENYQSNAFYEENNSYIFSTYDPQILIDCPEKNVKKMLINLDYIAIGKKSFDYIFKCKDRLLNEKSELIQEKENQIQEKENQIQEKENQIQEKIELINRNNRYINSLKNELESEKISHNIILNSKSWKITAPLRWVFMKPKQLKRKLNTGIYAIFNQEYRLIEKSGLFNTEYYLNRNYDVRELNVNPLVQYIESGAKQGKDPNPLFDTSYYLDENPDVAKSGVNPLAHYIEVGFKEERDPNALFDTSYYLEQNPDVVESGMNPLLHYLNIGIRERRDPNPFFDTSYYLEQSPDAVESEMSPLEHYMKIGFKNGINPNPFFNTSYYLDRNRDVMKSKINPLIHYIHVGAKEGKSINPLDTTKISIIAPVYNVDEIFLKRCIRSVLYQIYDNWELCLIDDGSTKAHIKPILEKYAKDDPRIKVKFLKENQGVSAALNEGASLATGEYLTFMDHDDEMKNNALYEVFDVIHKHCPDVIYSDESIIDGEGRTLGKHFKSDYSPDLLLSHNYITHLLIVKKSLFHEIGGFSSEYDSAQDYDLVLRLVERTNNIYHIPKILYYWRNISTSISSGFEKKYNPENAGKNAIQAALKRREIDANILAGYCKYYYRVKRVLIDHPLVSIIIPFKDEPKYLRKCIEGILYETDYQNIEIICIDNNSKKPETYDLINFLKEKDKRIAFYQHKEPFNFSKINNYGFEFAKGEHVVFMNNDIEVINSDWIECMLEHSQRKDVGVVGPLLYYPDDTVQHAGVIIGLGGVAAHSHRNMPRDSAGHFGRLKAIQNLSAVTGACMMTKKAIFKELGGFDEYLTHAYNDIDYCLRVRAKGYLIVFTPYAELYHHESISRGYENNPEKRARLEKEKEYFQSRWKNILDKGDPYYNPNLTLDKEDFSPRNFHTYPNPLTGGLR